MANNLSFYLRSSYPLSQISIQINVIHSVMLTLNLPLIYFSASSHHEQSIVVRKLRQVVLATCISCRKDAARNRRIRISSRQLITTAISRSRAPDSQCTRARRFPSDIVVVVALSLYLSFVFVFAFVLLLAPRDDLRPYFLHSRCSKPGIRCALFVK